MDAVRLVAAQVPDPGKATRSVGESGEGRDGGGELADGRQINIDPAQGPRARKLDVRSDALDARAHEGEDPSEFISRLGRLFRPVLDRDGAAGNEGRRDERARVGKIGLNGNRIGQAQLAWCDGPFVITIRDLVASIDAALAKECEGHLDMGE